MKIHLDAEDSRSSEGSGRAPRHCRNGKGKTPREGKKARRGAPHDSEEVLRNPCILDCSQHQARGEKQEWLPRPFFLGGPNKGTSCT